MGGLAVTPIEPAPRYEFEMLKKDGDESEGDSPTLFLHYKGSGKHYIPGMETNEDIPSCRNGGRKHKNFFEERPPCIISEDRPTRASLTSCLWDTSPRCMQYMPSVDPTVRRTVVIVRDPRNVVLSERKMRIDFFHHERVMNLPIDDFVRKRFEVIVSWTHQRWVWHTTSVVNISSHIVIYEDLQESYAGFIDLAAFMGLECSESSAAKVWESHHVPSPDDAYNNHGLQNATLEWMNTTMARLLPATLALRWGLNPTEL